MVGRPYKLSRRRSAMAQQEQLAGQAARYRTNLQGEVDSAALYRALADAEHDPRLARGLWPAGRGRGGACRILAQAARPLGAAAGGCGPGWRTPGAGLAGAPLRPAIRAADGQHARAPRQRRTMTTSRRRVAGGLPAAERSHARIVQAMAGAVAGRRSPAARWRGSRAAIAGRRQRAARRGARRQ